MTAADNSDDNAGADVLDFMEYNGDGKESRIEKVSGEEEVEERRALVLDKFRVLLGLRSFDIRRGRGDNEFLAPSPAPSNENPAPAPAPAPNPILPHRFVRSHHSPTQSRPIPLQPNMQGGHEDKSRVKRIVIAVALSCGVAFVGCALGFTLLCQKFRRRRKRRSEKTKSNPNVDIRFSRSKYLPSPNSVRKVSFDLGPEHFYLTALEQVVESNSSHVKQTSETVEVLSKQNQTSSPNPARKVSFDLGPEHFYPNTLEQVVDSKSLHIKQACETVEVLSEQNPLDRRAAIGRESIKFDAEGAGCSSEDEIVSVHEAEESTNGESEGGTGSLGNKIVPVESSSSDDESFHSICNSHASSTRVSNASKEDLDEPSDNFSSKSYKIGSPTDPSHAHSSHSMFHPSNPSVPSPKLTPSTMQSSSITRKHVPSPPPPPPTPPILPSRRPQTSSFSSQILKKIPLSSTMSNASSPQNSDSSSSSNITRSSSGSNATPPSDSPSPSLIKPHQASTSQATAKTTPLPPSPQLPPAFPPPPPPPTFLKSAGKTFQPPPPPPGKFFQQNLVGKDGTPLPKLKPLHWDKVRATPDRSMIWDKLRSSSFELDEKMIESLFGYNLQIKNNDEAKSKTPSPSKHILEPKRLQNITILSKAINATPEQVCAALIQGDGLSLQQLEALVKMVPTKDEETKLLSHRRDTGDLSTAEKFVRTILNVPFAFLRIEAMLYRDTFEDEVIHLRKSFAMLEDACKELQCSRLFLKLLEAVLKTGNRMNVGTIRGGARAFKLDTLLKLADVKGTDGKTTLLHFVVQEMVRSEKVRESEPVKIRETPKANKSTDDKEENYIKMGLDLVSGLSAELCNVKKTASVDLDVLASSVSNLSEGMVKLKHLVNEGLSNENKQGNFVNSMKSFLKYAEKNINELKKDEDRILLQVKEITEYFHGDVSKDEANPLRIFVIVRDFLGMLDQP
ncbi:hypothetical protein Syun_028832 [Stephania yunnanensis]|uniref:Formin-like protein n=1 Tax=Stephania yunnanensis TaxID=152371 RepID=A0AAP0EC74_9MAGN